MGGDRAGHRSVGVDIAVHKEWWIEMGTVDRNGYSGHRQSWARGYGQSWAQQAQTELSTMELGTAQWAQTELGTIDMDGVGHSGHGHRDGHSTGQSWSPWLWTELGMVDMKTAGVGERVVEIMEDLRIAMFPKKVLLAKKNRWRERQRRSL